MKTAEAESNQAIFLQQQIDLYTEELVEMADKTLSEARMKKIVKDRNGLKTAQLNNLLGVAQESPSVAPIRNWVHFQMGRRETSRAWSDSGFGEDVLNNLKEISKFAQEAVKAAFKDADITPTKKDLRETNLKMVRLYAGYLKRWFVARGGQN
ncbi:MAG: hypothetical protein KC433_03605 [Anaerolineales bacterium]|nr:hypothetical protein [Anaerolineales bacterium]MCB8937006.1 hypothetical protein [Ardenticatenaceae bacterium]